MSDTPKRRGRPPKRRVQDWPSADEIAARLRKPMPVTPTDAALKAVVAGMVNLMVEGAMATIRLRLKAGTLQQAWQHPTGTQWRDVPAVADSAPDWEDSP